jgi:hypothetical protein
MENEEFAALVADEVKNKASDEDVEYLRRSDNLVRWQEALFTLLSNLNSQIEEINSAEAASSRRYKEMGNEGVRLLVNSSKEYEDRRRKITRFKFHVEVKLDNVTRMINVIDEASVEKQASLAAFYKRAIMKHREVIDELEYDFSEADEALWECLSGNWTFDSIKK